MSFDVWFPDDMRRLLGALALSGERFEDDVYRAGYLDALVQVGMAFGVEVVETRVIPGVSGASSRRLLYGEGGGS